MSMFKMCIPFSLAKVIKVSKFTPVVSQCLIIFREHTDLDFVMITSYSNNTYNARKGEGGSRGLLRYQK